MTYFGFLFRFLIIPILILLGLTWLDHRRGRQLPARLSSWPVVPAILIHVLIALLYTTPWDNYLVATEVWWYDPALVTGITLGWVPIEEYTFFILQPIMTGLWWWWVARRWGQAVDQQPLRTGLRKWTTIALAPIWLASVAVLLLRWQPGTYLALELGWALPPIALQLIFGADILWRYRRPVTAALAIPTLFLAAMDAVAISAGTWTISPDQSLHFLIGGILPLEEFVFFLITNTLIVFGITLLLAEESQVRLAQVRSRWQALMSGRRDDRVRSARR